MTRFTKAVQQAKKELENETVSEIKEMIKETLEAIEEVKVDISDKQKELQILKADLKDIEAGRVGRIKERQEKDKRAREVSKIDVDTIKEELKGLGMMSDSTSTGTTLGNTWGTTSMISNTNAINVSTTAGVPTFQVTSAANVGSWDDLVGGTYITKSGKSYFIN